MRGLFWLALGAGVAVAATRKMNRLADSVSPGGLTDRAAGIGQMLHEFSEQVRVGMADRERELRAALGLDEKGPDEKGPDEKGDGRAGTRKAGM